MIKEDILPETGSGDAAFDDWQGTHSEWAERAGYFDYVVSAAQRELDGNSLAHRLIDELAIMVHDEHQEYHLIEQLVRVGGWQLFNAAVDDVSTYPIGSDYKVHYTFLKHPDRGYRLEVMRLMEGLSPLHAILNDRAINVGFGRPILVHASFKVESIGALGNAEDQLLNGGYMLAQGCRSTYGAFAYYVPTQDNDGDLSVYLKPRVNLRDAS